MRTTINIEDGLLERAKLASHTTGKSLGEVVEDALRMALATRVKADGVPQVKPLKTFCGTGMMPGVDLDSTSELLEVMEQP